MNGGVSPSAIAESCGTLEQSHTVIRVLFDMLVASRRMAKTGSEKVKDLDQEVMRLSRVSTTRKWRALPHHAMAHDQSL